MKRQLIAVSMVTLVAQIAGYAKLWLMARLFGVGPELDGYYLGFVLPSLVTGVLSGILQVSFMPVHAEIRIKDHSEAARRFERFIFLAVAGSCAAVTILLILASDRLSNFVAGDASEAVHRAVYFVLPIAGLAVLLNGIGDYLTYLLAVYNRYTVASAAPIANTVVSALLLAAWPEGGLANLTLGTIFGTVVQVAICLTTAIRLGFRPFGALPSKSEGFTAGREMYRIVVWTIPGVIFSNATVSLPPMLISRYGDGAVAAFGYANRLSSAFYLLLMAGAPVMLAQFAIMRARGETRILHRLLHKAGWISALFGAIAVAVVWTLGSQILGLLLASGRFDATAVARTAQHWSWLTLGLGFSVWGNVIAKYIQADRRPAVLSAHAGLVLLVFWSSSMLLAFMKEFSISTALSAAAAVSAILLHLIAQLGLSDALSKYRLGKFYR